jgi:DNA-binding NarL/FixJ family response regulator
LARRLGWLLTDRATWRDLRWILVNLAGWLLTALPAAIVLTGLIEFIGPELLRTIPPPAFPGHAAGTLILLGLGIIAVGVVAAPWLLRGYALLASSMLAPTFTDEGIRAALAARRKVPGLPVLVLSQYVEQLYARELLASGTGGIGYLLKDRVFDSAQFVDAVRRVAAGGTAMDPEVISRLLARNSGAGTLAVLSPREREVLALMAEGRSNAAIAQRMVITERAVAKHTASIFTRLNLQPSDDDNRRVLAVLAYLGG